MYIKVRRAVDRGLLLFLLLSLAAASGAQTLDSKWQGFDFSKQMVRPAELQGLKPVELKFLRGIVFGRHGRIFKDQDIQQFLGDQAWYRPDDNFSNNSLNATERANLDLIREKEAAWHKKIEPGDLRFYRDRAFTLDQVGKHSLAELRVMWAEMEAIHGKRFDDEPWLQAYFEARYWYRPAQKYDPSQLTATERRNLQTMAAAEKDQRNLKVSLGDMRLFQERPLTDDLLDGLGLYELRLMRNEVYALHGRTFKTVWIQQYFNDQDWYHPNEDDREPALSDIEKRNIATILHREDAIHVELGTKPVSTALLSGLFLEDARKLRNEIFARHGRVFKDKWLQQYFSSFSWYHADPNFKDSSLNPVERQNVAAILKYEGQAESLASTVEG